jgi:hypothetical protein
MGEKKSERKAFSLKIGIHEGEEHTTKEEEKRAEIKKEEEKDGMYYCSKNQNNWRNFQTTSSSSPGTGTL